MGPLIGYRNWSDVNTLFTPTFSGGSWNGALPLTNLQDRRLSKVARSTNAALTSTKFDVDLLRQAHVGVIALPKHTVSTAGKARVRGFTAVPCYDSLTVGDAAWTSGGTPTRAAAAFTCADGMPLDRIGDDDNVSVSEYFSRTLTFTGNGTKVLKVRIARFSAYNGHVFFLNDSTAGTNRLVVTLNFTTTTLGVTMTTGTLLSQVDRGDGSWDLVFSIPSVVAANVNTFIVYPAGAGPATDVAQFYMGNVVAWNSTIDEQSFEGGVRDVWPIVYPAGSLAAGDPRLVASGGTGKYTAEEALQTNIGFTVVPTAPVTGRYWRIEIDDTTNAAGYIDISRLMICDTYAPTVAPQPGNVKFKFESASARQDTDGGASVFIDRPRRRVLEMLLSYAPTDEALVSVQDMMMQFGISQQMMVVYEQSDTYHMPRRSFLATLRELSALEYPFYGRNHFPVAFIEEL